MTKDEELSAELREFIDRLIVPLLVEQIARHLYTAEPSYYDDDAEGAGASRLGVNYEEQKSC